VEELLLTLAGVDMLFEYWLDSLRSIDKALAL